MQIHHIGLEVQNLEDSISFYKNEMGFEIENRFSFIGEEIAFLCLHGFRIELIEGQQESTHLCFEVSNLNEMMKQFSSVEILEGPYTLQNGWKTVFYKGPNNHIIEFLQTDRKRAI
ncbi:VOC family protein [Robertmurraya andreesenii]|uniref:Lactoylglutathione lyase n=1 Tax=Anoxybacillus andreesenii TaxID=1325932 RepID=A0ABT9V7P4_9BACL|nr:VOC family protein [Robertmurraya andreesenii]MDQ0156961.1 lactoylglutathione lyase [Robertmurraya andreesenii]